MTKIPCANGMRRVTVFMSIELVSNLARAKGTQMTDTRKPDGKDDAQAESSGPHRSADHVPADRQPVRRVRFQGFGERGRKDPLPEMSASPLWERVRKARDREERNQQNNALSQDNDSGSQDTAEEPRWPSISDDPSDPSRQDKAVTKRPPVRSAENPQRRPSYAGSRQSRPRENYRPRAGDIHRRLPLIWMAEEEPATLAEVTGVVVACIIGEIVDSVGEAEAKVEITKVLQMIPQPLAESVATDANLPEEPGEFIVAASDDEAEKPGWGWPNYFRKSILLEIERVLRQFLPQLSRYQEPHATLMKRPWDQLPSYYWGLLEIERSRLSSPALQSEKRDTPVESGAKSTTQPSPGGDVELTPGDKPESERKEHTDKRKTADPATSGASKKRESVPKKTVKKSQTRPKGKVTGSAKPKASKKNAPAPKKTGKKPESQPKAKDSGSKKSKTGDKKKSAPAQKKPKDGRKRKQS